MKMQDKISWEHSIPLFQNRTIFRVFGLVILFYFVITLIIMFSLFAVKGRSDNYDKVQHFINDRTDGDIDK